MAKFRTTTANVLNRQCDQVDQENDEQIKDCFGISLFQRHATIVAHNRSDALRRATLMVPDDGNAEVEATLLEVHKESRYNTSKQTTDVTDYTRLYKNERLDIYHSNTAWRWSGWISEPLKEFCRVQLNPDENLVVYHAKNNVFKPLWQTGPHQAGSTCKLAPRTCSLECGAMVGNWERGVYRPKLFTIWSSSRVGPCDNPILVMQTDCNLVLYSGEGLPAVWFTQTSGFVNRIR